MENNVKFSVQIEEQDLYKYNLHHTYTSMQGILSVVIAVILLGAWAYGFSALSSTYKVVYPVIALLFLVYIPMNLKLRVKNQMTQEVFKCPLTYELKDSCIEISSPVSEEPAQLPWEYIYKIVTWKGYLLIYSSRVNAYIIPKDQITAEYDNIVTFIKAHVEDYKLSIK